MFDSSSTKGSSSSSTSSR